MAFCVEVSAEGYLYQSNLSLDQCSSLVIQTVGEYKVNQLKIEPS